VAGFVCIFSGVMLPSLNFDELREILL
jgi:hypothetical protein